MKTKFLLLFLLIASFLRLNADDVNEFEIKIKEEELFYYWDSENYVNLLNGEILSEKPDQIADDEFFNSISVSSVIYIRNKSFLDSKGEKIFGDSVVSFIHIDNEKNLILKDSLLSILGSEKISLDKLFEINPEHKSNLLSLIFELEKSLAGIDDSHLSKTK